MATGESGADAELPSQRLINFAGLGVAISMATGAEHRFLAVGPHGFLQVNYTAYKPIGGIVRLIRLVAGSTSVSTHSTLRLCNIPH